MAESTPISAPVRGHSGARLAADKDQQIDLSARDSQAVAKAFVDPSPVNDRLRETVRRYRNAIGV